MSIDTATVNPIVDAAISLDKRVATLPDKQRELVAIVMSSGLSYDQAIAMFAAAAVTAEETLKTARDEQKKYREDWQKAFESVLDSGLISQSISGVQLQAPATVATDKVRPIAVHIIYDSQSPQKNEDGSPKMDGNNNPVYATSVDYRYTWEVRRANASGGTSNGTGRTRTTGFFLFGGHEYSKMSELVDAAYKAENKAAPSLKSRKEVEALGLHFAQTGEKDGKRVWTISKAAANGTAAAE